MQPALNLKCNRSSHWSINKLITANDRIGDTCCRFETITGHQLWKREKYYYNILRVLMTTFIIRLVAILFILSQAVNSMHIKCELNWYFSTVKKYRIFFTSD